MNKYVVAITLDKVQSFVYKTFKSNTNSNQLDENTLQKVVQASEGISVGFTNKIKNVFGFEAIQDELLFISGKVIFTVTISEEEANERLQELFADYYYQTEGQLRLNYTVFEFNGSKIDIVKEANKRLRSVACMNKVIEDNRRVLFTFPNCEMFKETEKGSADFKKEKYPLFINGIDDLKPKQKSKHASENDEFFRMAVIKADLDGMGNLFSNIDIYERYSIVSEVLEGCVCIDYFHNLLEEQKKRKKLMEEQKSRKLKDGEKKIKEHSFIEKVLPLYVAGDDIFLVVQVQSVFVAVDLLKVWLDRINTNLKKKLEYKGLGFQEELTLSVGIEIVAHSLPLRYMYEQVEIQLAHAKESIHKDHKLNISIYNQNFHVFQRSKGSNSMDGWNGFKKEIALIEKLKAKENDSQAERLKNEINGMISTRFFYQLLEKVTNGDVKNNALHYANIVFNHLMPESNEKEDVSKLKSVLLNQFSEGFKGKWKQRNLVLNDSSKQERFEKKLRLFILFSDSRYEIDTAQFGEITDKKIKSSLVLKSQRYLYEQITTNPVGKLFVERKEYSGKEKEFNKKKRRYEWVEKTFVYYPRVPIKTSMFYKLKSLLKLEQEQMISKISKMVKHASGMYDKGEYEPKIHLDHERKYNKEFDEVKFKNLASSSDWNENLIDSLMIFYKYIDILNQWSKKEVKNNGVRN